MDSTVRVDGDMTVLKIEWDPEIRTIEDSILKNPMMAMLGGAVADQAAEKIVDEGFESGGNALGGGKFNLVSAQQDKEQKEKDLEQAEQKVTEAESQQEQQGQQTAKDALTAQQNKPTEMPAQAKVGSQITGMKGNEQAGDPTSQPGTEATAPPVPFAKTYFMDNFGIQGSDLIDLLHKGGEDTALEYVIDLLRQEQHAVLKGFGWWDEADWDMLELKDNDYNLLRLYPERLEFHLRKTLASLKRGDEEPDEIWKSWHDRLNAESRLSRRERVILEESLDTVRKHGDMNAQTITSYGVKATTQEVASLIKSYGFLYDLKVVGKGTKSDDRTLYYGTTKQPIFLKKIDSFIANLWEVGGELDALAPQGPRLVLPFNTNRGEDYTAVIKKELGIEGISWEGQGFVIEGNYAFNKAAEGSIRYLDEKKADAAILLTALNKEHQHNSEALKLLTLQNNNRYDGETRAEIAKEVAFSPEEVITWTEVIVNGY